VPTLPRRRPLGPLFSFIRPQAQLPRKFVLKKLHGLRFGIPGRSLRAISSKRVRIGTNFALRVGENISAHAGVSKDAALIEAIRRQTPFETYRPRLWHMLTHR
jgi:hypothetical protein